MEKLLTAAQDLTNGWVNLGKPISTANYNKLALWFDIDINDSTDVQFRALPQKINDSSAIAYSFPIKLVSSSKINIQAEYFELSVDADQNVAVQIQLDQLVPYLQIQVKAGVVGAAAGQIDGAEYNAV